MSVTRGFVDYRIGAVIKFGGSLLKERDACQAALDALSRASAGGHRLLVVPGGGPTDDTIEALDGRHGFHADTHHHACALAQDQTGLMICDPLWGADVRWCRTLDRARRIIDDGKVAVLLPSELIFALDPFERTWDITSDAMAVYFSWLVGAEKTVILTNVDGIFAPDKVGKREALIASITAGELERMGDTAVDKCTPSYLKRKQMDCWILHGGQPTRLLTLLGGGTPVGTLIRGARWGGAVRALEELVDAGDATLSVLSPDAARSGLVGAVVSFVEESTGAIPVRSLRIRHTEGSIEQFYRTRVAANLPYWYLVSRLFRFGTSIGLVWVGSGVQRTLSELKGGSHPAEAAGGTIRSMFWCDNAVCNLIHVSDGPLDVERELEAVGYARLMGRSISMPAAPAEMQRTPAARAQPRHCGALMALAVARRSLPAGSAGAARLAPAVREDARRTQEQCQKHLLRTAEENVGVRSFVESYLRGDLDRMRAHAEMLTASKWERFVLDCGCLGRRIWNRSDVRSAVRSIVKELPAVGRWLISGSAAMRLHGSRVVPRDIDVWLDRRAFFDAAEKLGGEVRRARLDHGRADRMTMERMGWKVEYTGPVVRPSGREMAVDRDMMARARGHVQPLEDLIAELLVMKRPSPRHDLDRAYALYQRFRCQNRRYLFASPARALVRGRTAWSFAREQVAGTPGRGA